MECFADHSFLEELLALRSEPIWEAVSITDEFCNNGGWSSNNTTNLPNFAPNSSMESYFTLPTSKIEQNQSLNYCSLFTECYNYGPFGDELSSPPDLMDSTYATNKLENPPFPSPGDLSSIVGDEITQAAGLLIRNSLPDFEIPDVKTCGIELKEYSESPPLIPSTANQAAAAAQPVFDMGIPPEREGKTRKPNNGQPSKNLMAERRRRKRLNDRLSMLRSVVPKISKMDRTAILGDTIDYMKELLERIKGLQEEEKGVGSNHDEPSLMSIFKDVKPNEVLVRNSPKFNVEKSNRETRIEICCAGKPGLLLSTLTTLDALGLELQQCVISCFNDFTLHASCSSEEMERMGILSSEDIKQALFRNAGYGGRCF
ncbi:OLC1v1017154C1 [Oldenlandia corymbosa var. corymbosa]|uniref:OLC1v1017154C1 n=1 Tax=Oldenlandia corymbosa var. corymbosa TaxID=529605 RepID=A0AAV1E8S3_OLDCO|nr:OLC1v1017154C1 [Oldenlandia corymbosa var. corymbosa]